MSVIKSCHDVKCQVFKNNYGRLRDGFRSSGFSIKGFLYSRDVISAETRDTHDMEKVLADVEVKLKFSETTWETLLSGMSEPPLDVLCCDLRRELQVELSKDHVGITDCFQIDHTTETTLFSPPKSLPIPSDEQHPKQHIKDSGCGSTTVFDYRNYPDNCFPLPSSSSTDKHKLSSPTKSDPSIDPTSIHSTLSSVPSTDSSELSTDSGAVSSTDSFNPITDMSSDIKTDHTDYSLMSPDHVALRALSHDSGCETTQPPVPASQPPVPPGLSELVNSLQNKKTGNQVTNNGDTPPTSEAGLSLYKRISSLEVENNSLRITKKQIVDQIKDLEEENDYLMDIRKADQQLLEYKMHQVAQENELLGRKQEFIRRLENDNRRLKKDLKTSFAQQELLMKRNEELMFRIQLAERSTSLSAITIDQLKCELSTRNNVIEQLRQELSQYREWYTTLASCNNSKDDTCTDGDNYMSMSRTESN